MSQRPRNGVGRWAASGPGGPTIVLIDPAVSRALDRLLGADGIRADERTGVAAADQAGAALDVVNVQVAGALGQYVRLAEGERDGVARAGDGQVEHRRDQATVSERRNCVCPAY